MIDIENVSVTIANKEILKPINLSFSKTGVVGIIGPNGAGKTTLAKVLCHLIEFNGLVRLDGKNLDDIDATSRAAIISYCGELPSDIELSVKDIISYARVNKVEDKQLLQDILSIFDLEPILDQKIYTLSGGERQRVNLAAAFYQDSKVIILDEPTNFLDPLHIDMLEKAILKQSLNHLVLVVSHHINFICNTTGRVLGLKNGSLIFNEEISNLFEDKHLDNLFEREFKYSQNEEGVFVK